MAPKSTAAVQIGNPPGPGCTNQRQAVRRHMIRAVRASQGFLGPSRFTTEPNRGAVRQTMTPSVVEILATRVWPRTGSPTTTEEK